jgi:hypothetical protein
MRESNVVLPSTSRAFRIILFFICSAESSTEPVDTQYLLWASFCEIYNDNVYDLLLTPQENNVAMTTKDKAMSSTRAASAPTYRPKLTICEDDKNNTYIKGNFVSYFVMFVFVQICDTCLLHAPTMYVTYWHWADPINKLVQHVSIIVQVEGLLF